MKVPSTVNRTSPTTQHVNGGAPNVSDVSVQSVQQLEGQEQTDVAARFQADGETVSQSEAHTDANFAAGQKRPSSGGSVLNLQIARETGSVEMSGNVEALPPEGSVEDIAAIQRARVAQELQSVPTVADLEAIKSGDANVSDVVRALKQGLLSSNPKVVKKAANTLQTAESYARKAAQDRENYAGTGFKPYSFPSFKMEFNADETVKLMQRVSQGGDRNTASILLMASDRDVIQTSPAHVFHSHRGMMGLQDGRSGQLPGSDGREAPRGASTFREEWETQVKPGLTNISEAIADTAKVKGPGCPYAQGNHAKGVAFDNAEMKLDAQAPDWAKDLFGPSLKGGMIRISGSQTDPDQPDQESHMPGIRIAFPVNGSLDGSATQTIDITANTGSTTHAQTAAEHTQFTKDISVPKKGLFGLRPVRAAKHALGALFGPGKVLDRVKAMRNAVEVTDMAMGQKFHDHKFFGRHAFFVGGRYVQVRFEVVEPQDFPDPSKSNDPNARLNAVEQTVERKGLKLAMYMTELPDGNPDMVEQEGWEGLPEVRLATIDVPPQEHDNHSKASQWFEKVPHVPGGADKVFHAAGLGRHRVPIYMQSGKVRNDYNSRLLGQ